LISKLASSDKGKFLWRGGHAMNEKINWTLNVQAMGDPIISASKTREVDACEPSSITSSIRNILGSLIEYLKSGILYNIRISQKQKRCKFSATLGLPFVYKCPDSRINLIKGIKLVTCCG
jgi:hypothetical protein